MHSDALWIAQPCRATSRQKSIGTSIVCYSIDSQKRHANNSQQLTPLRPLPYRFAQLASRNRLLRGRSERWGHERRGEKGRVFAARIPRNGIGGAGSCWDG